MKQLVIWKALVTKYATTSYVFKMAWLTTTPFENLTDIFTQKFWEDFAHVQLLNLTIQPAKPP